MKKIWRVPARNQAGIEERFNALMRRTMLFTFGTLRIAQFSVLMLVGLFWMVSFAELMNRL